MKEKTFNQFSKLPLSFQSWVFEPPKKKLVIKGENTNLKTASYTYPIFYKPISRKL